MSRCLLTVALLLIASQSTAQADASASKQPKQLVGQLVHTTTDDGKYQVHLRPLVTTVYPGDSFAMVMHFSGKDKPLDPYAEATSADMSKVLASLTWTVSTPSGTTYELKGGVTDGRQKWLKGKKTLGRQATHVFTLDHQQMKTVGSGGGIVIQWASDKPFPKFDQPGVYQLTVKGDFQFEGKPVALKIPPVVFKVDKSVQPLGKAIETATAALAKHVPAAKLMKHQTTESGYERDMIHEDKEGNRLVDLNTMKAGFKWGYDLVRITISPKGEVIKVQEREVFTCIAEGVLIDTPTGQRKIESLRRGDQVWAYDTKTEKRVITTVQTIRRGVAGETITLPGGLRVTPNHPVFANCSWKAAGQLMSSDQLLALTGTTGTPGTTGKIQTQAASDMLRQIGTVDVFDLTVGEPHNFFAGSILVHNKDRIWHHTLDDPWYFTWPAKPHKWETVFARED